MEKIYKVLGQRGRITIPFAIRIKLGFKYNDIVSFEQKEDNTIIVKREKLCDCSKMEKHTAEKPTDETTLLEFLDGLSSEEQRAALVHLSCKWAELQRKKPKGK